MKNSYIIISIWLTIVWCISCSSAKQGVRNAPQKAQNALSIDTTKLKVIDWYYFDQPINSSEHHEREIAIEIKIYDNNLLGKLRIENGLLDDDDYDYFLFLDNNGTVAPNQDYLWVFPSDTIHGIVLDRLPKSIDSISLRSYGYPQQPDSWTRNKLKLKLGKIPFRKQNQYKSLALLPNIRGHLYRELTHNDFLVRSYDNTGNNYVLVKVNINSIPIKADTLNLRNIISFTQTDSTWTAFTLKRVKREHFNDKEKRHYIISGNCDNGFDLDNYNSVEIYGKYPTKSVELNGKMIYFNWYSPYRLINDTMVLDSFLISYGTSLLGSEINRNNKFAPVEYSNNKYAIRFGDYLINEVNDNWNILYKVDSLGSNLESSISLDDSGFFFIANRRAYFYNYKNTMQILPNYSNIMTVNEGPNDFVIFELGSNETDAIGVLYNYRTKECFPIRSSRINANTPSYLFRYIKYRELTNSIVILTHMGLYEIDIDELIATESIEKRR